MPQSNARPNRDRLASLPRILVVDDEPLILMAVEAALVEAGYVVSTIDNTPEALAAIGSANAAPAAVIIDIDLDGEAAPGCGSGWDVARYARRRFADLPVVYMTGDSGSDWTFQGVPNSILILKPFAIDQVVTAVSQLINRRGASPAP